MAKANEHGFFGQFGGQYIPETLVPAIKELEQTYLKVKKTAEFKAEFKALLKDYVGRPTPLYHAKNLSKDTGYKVYLKREDLNHTGAHKIINTIGQILLAKHMGKSRIIAETGAGQHGVATATVCALMNMPCTIYMGEEDTERQALNVYRMQLLGATVQAVNSGSKTLKDATSEAIRDWMASSEHTHYIIGSVVGPHPYPTIVRDFQSIIGKEAKKQILEKEKDLPAAVIACVGGGSNAMGIFHAFERDRVRLFAIEAAGYGLNKAHAASLSKGNPGILHGARSQLLQSDTGQIQLAHSISAGLDYPAVGPELAHLADIGRITKGAATDRQALDALKWVCKREGILPALETAHAFAYLKRNNELKKGSIVLLNVSGRGDKDVSTIIEKDAS